jgi:hypothetical protein
MVPADAPATEPTEVNHMDALLAISAIVFILVAIAALSSAFGVDSRDGFANERLRSGLS